jgi:putative acetyltransferase
MRVTKETPDQPDVIALIAELDAYQDSLYPAEARYALDLASLKEPTVVFAVARDSNGRALGCGAVVISERHGELKRMYVRQESRGQGVARQVLKELEASASRIGCKVLLLETGPYQSEALAFYEKQGYVRRGPFGTYPEHPLSVFMGKALATQQLSVGRASAR